MSGRAFWGGIAGAANALQGYWQQQREMENRTKMYAMEQDIMQKREEALAQIRANLQDSNAANRSQRAMDRDQFKHDLTSGDVTGAFKDEETGNYYGRTKTGDVVPLNITSDDYQDFKKRIAAGKANEADLAPEKTQSQITRNNAQTANYNSSIEHRDSLDPEGDKIRADYQKQINARRVQAIKAADAAKKAGDPPPGAFDENAASQDVTAQLYSVYGADKVKNALGGANNVPRSQRVGPAAAPPQAQPPQQNRPTVEQLTAQATAAVQAGADQKAVEARLQQLMAQYGYQPQ